MRFLPRSRRRRARAGGWSPREWALVVLFALAASALLRARSPAPDAPPAPVLAAELPRIVPARLESAEAAVVAALEDSVSPGAALAVGIGPRIGRIRGYGRIGWRPSSPPVSPDSTLYDLASVTKAVATTTAVLLLAEDGRIDLDEPVQNWLPSFEGQLKDRVTWRHLLTHTSGLPGGAVIRGDTPRERLRRILRTRIDEAPGRHVEYTDLGFVVAWEAAQRAAGEPLPKFLERRVWRPLGMRHTAFSPGTDCEPCAPTLRLRGGVPFRGKPSDLLARRLGGTVGSAGLFSSAGDLARFSAMVANGGELGGVRILSEASVREMTTQQPGAGRRTLGWQAFCPDEPPREELACERPLAVGHTGWAGTSLWLDPRTGTWAVLLTNRSYEMRRRDTEARVQRLRERVWRRLVGGDAG